MSINRVDFGTVPNPVTGDWAKLSAVVEKAFQNINVPLQVDDSNIPEGATFQIGGVVYYTASVTAITGTPSAYVKLTPNVGDVGATCDAAFVANLTGVTWNGIRNGYYDASGNLYIFDEAVTLDKRNTRTGIQSFPIGYVYTQYPTKKSPTELGFAGTWTPFDYAGDFFRSEGGDASAFESGEQPDVIKNHTHPYTDASPTGSANVGFGPPLISALPTFTSPSRTTSNNTGGSADETRPKNRTIKLWERTA